MNLLLRISIALLLGCSSDESPSEICVPISLNADVDSDGFGTPYVSVVECEPFEGYVSNILDCDDSNPMAFPGQSWYLDIDGDGFGDPLQVIEGCIQPIGYVLDNTDCDDLDSTRNPIDQWYLDLDDDGYGIIDSPIDSCQNIEQASSRSDDCDDGNALIHPDANEICDSLDNNCNLLIDNDDPQLDIYTQIPMYLDEDGDGYGSEEYLGQFCSSYPLGSQSNDDCNDLDEMFNPSQFELFDEVDQNCDDDPYWYSVSNLDSGFTHSESSTNFGRYLDSMDIDGDNRRELVISSPTYSFNPNTDTDDGKVIWIDGQREADWSDLSGESRYWFGEEDDDLYGIWAGDMDGDGVADLLMGSREKNNKSGAVYLISSDAGSGMVTEQSTWTWAVPNNDLRLASTLLRVGDVDQDGFDDVMVGASHYDVGGSNSGGAFLLRGSDVGVVSDPTSGTVICGSGNGHQFGLRSSQAGDINADGILDVLVSSIYADEEFTNSGSVYLFPVTDLLSTGLIAEDLVQFYGEAEQDKAGSQVSSAGDVNGDGYDDILIGANDHDENFDQDGAVYLIYGQSYEDFALYNPLSSADAIFIGAFEHSGFADDIESLGDINGDALDDFAIGSYLADPTGSNRGLVIGLLGQQFSGKYNIDDVADFMLRGYGTNHRIGMGMAQAGDLNGDGLEDNWIGCVGCNAYDGQLFLFDGLLIP